MPQDEPRKELILTEAQFREVIERATRADLRADGISETILRQVAEELDIDPGALQQALVEVVGVPAPVQPGRRWLGQLLTKTGRLLDLVLPRRGRLTAGVVLGSSLGWLCAHVTLGLHAVIDGTSVSLGSSSFVDVPVFIFMVALTFANLLSRRLDGRFGRYLAEVAGLWGAFALGWAVTFGAATNDLAVTTALTVAGATAWGWLVIGRRPGARWFTAGLRRTPAALPSTTCDDMQQPLRRTATARLVAFVVRGLSVPQVARIEVA